MDEDALVRRLDEIETMGGPVGAEACQAELAAWRAREPDLEARLSLPTPISQLVFLTVARRYGLKPFRVSRQRKTSVSVRAPSGFVNAVLEPRLHAMVAEMEEAAIAAVQRVMNKWMAGASARETRADVPGDDLAPS